MEVLSFLLDLLLTYVSAPSHMVVQCLFCLKNWLSEGVVYGFLPTAPVILSTQVFEILHINHVVQNFLKDVGPLVLLVRVVCAQYACLFSNRGI